MKKRMSRKLVLAKETLQNLDAPQLQDALGRYGTMETQCCATMLPCTVGGCIPPTFE